MTVKDIRKTVRITEDTEKFINKIGKGSNFNESFDNMIKIFNGKKEKELSNRISNLTKQCDTLIELEQELRNNIQDKLDDFNNYVSQIHRRTSYAREKIKELDK